MLRLSYVYILVYCIKIKKARTSSQTGRQIDRRTDRKTDNQ